MKKILFVNACVRPQSRTYALAKCVLDKVDGVVEELNLEKAGIVPLNWRTIQERDELLKNEKFSAPMLKFARQFANADEIVIAAPYWDLAFPSTVRIYFEAVTVCGITFKYTPEGVAKGLCKAKQITYVTTAGGPILQYNLGYDYVKALADTFYGIAQVTCVKAENLDIVGADVEAIMKKAIAEIN